MSDFCTITPSRGDRPQFLEFCKHQLSRMTVKPVESFFITAPPLDGRYDIVWRINAGVVNAKLNGIDKVYIIEDDDYYPVDYFERMPIGENDIVGCPYSFYYNLRNRTYQQLVHVNRSSLFCTGFSISGMNIRFNRFKFDSPNFDLALWRESKKKKRKFYDSGAVGIKHGIGLCGGRGHRSVLKHSDENMEWLKANVDSEAFEFYKGLKL
jgi:hypothetical protein